MYERRSSLAVIVLRLAGEERIPFTPFVYHGRALITQVIDRGPYVKGRSWDLTAAASEALGFEGVGQVRYAIATYLARQSANH